MFVEDRLVKTLEPCFKSFLEHRERYLTKKFVEEFIDMSKGLSKRSHKFQSNALSDQVALQGKQSQHALRIIRTLESFRETGEFK
ncbi:hypothetical protein, partial [Salmonella enterica]|uniref:hypothetical protein n=2 Tax=Enterobacteriaceae TaxID=543 RepID=UPI003D268318